MGAKFANEWSAFALLFDRFDVITEIRQKLQEICTGFFYSFNFHALAIILIGDRSLVSISLSDAHVFKRVAKCQITFAMC